MVFAMLLLLLSFSVVLINCDIYMHNMRGSNNRLDEKTAVRKNANRLFDSQNNERGGYNVGDKGTMRAGGKYSKQYRMQYFQSSSEAKSTINIEWTMQHGCGGNEDTNPHKLNCNIVLQYMCQPETITTLRDSTEREIEDAWRRSIRDGLTTDSNNHEEPNDMESLDEASRRQNDYTSGMHESYDWYTKCKNRKRNQGLFTAGQTLKEKVGSTATRQNPNGNKFGYECPEERDYYPYWHPTAWKDIVVFAQNASMCPYYVDNSFNQNPKSECVYTTKKGPDTVTNNEKDCIADGGEWLLFHNFLEVASLSEKECVSQGYNWALPTYGKVSQCLVPLANPDCTEAPWSRVNHLGNGAKGDLETANYVWELPNFPSNVEKRCVLRIRYNISTDDYDPYHTDHKNNANPPITNDPVVDIGAGVNFKLNINVAQFGRTFQDRSHVFKIHPRPSEIPSDAKIHNVNVRGKRGNIAQTFPAVEYDFSPTNLTMSEKDLVHIQWTGSNTHNNGGNGGDGQAGDAGEGKKGTDRSNVVPIRNLNHNYPMLSESEGNLFNNVKKVVWSSSASESYTNDDMTKADIYVQYASAGYYICADCDSKDSLEQKRAMNNLLNNADASYVGMVLQLKPGVYHYMCSRNNNFSNRSQKGTINVTPST